MNTESFIHDLAARDIHLLAKGEVLSVDAPKGTLTQALKQELKEHKAEILTLLRKSNSSLTQGLEVITGGQPQTIVTPQPAAHVYRVVVDGSRMTVIDPDRKLSEVFTKGIYDRFGEERVQTILRVR